MFPDGRRGSVGWVLNDSVERAEASVTLISRALLFVFNSFVLLIFNSFILLIVNMMF